MNPLRTRAIPERFCGGDSLLKSAISSVCTFTFTLYTDFQQNTVSITRPFIYYAALLPRRGPHIASHSVRLSVCLSVRPVLVYIRTVLRAHIQNRKTSVFDYRPASTLRTCGIFCFVYICGPHTVGRSAAQACFTTDLHHCPLMRVSVVVRWHANAPEKPQLKLLCHQCDGLSDLTGCRKEPTSCRRAANKTGHLVNHVPQCAGTHSTWNK